MKYLDLFIKNLPIYLSLLLVLTCAKEDNTSLIEGYQLQISQLNSKITEYSNQVTQLQSTVNSLNSQVNTIPGLEDTITSLNEQIGELEENIATLTNEVSTIPDLNDEITSLEETIASLNEQIEELEILVDIKNNPTPFIIYDTSFETNEFNNGYYSYHTTNLSDNGLLVVGIAYGDFNSDGYVDIIGKDENSPNYIKLYTNDGNGYYTSSILNIDNDSGVVSGVRKIITSDINNDSLLDIIYSEAPDDTTSPRGLFVLRNNGSTFTKFTLLNGERDWIHSVTAGDIDNDGYIDIFAGGKGYVFIGNGDFTFTKKDLPSTMTEWDWYNESFSTKGISQEMIDVNNDGYIDILMGYHISMDGTTIEEQSNTHVIHYGTGDESMFTEAYVLNSNYNGTNITLDFSVKDFDNDGDLDLFVNSSFNYQGKYVIQYYENNGYMNFDNKTNEVFENESNLVTNHYSIDWIKFIDMNNDGADELMIEGVNFEIQQNQQVAPSFNGWGLNDNNKLTRKMFN